METVTVKLDAKLHRWVKDQARQKRRSKSSIIRDLIAQELQSQKGQTLHDRMKHLCGCLEGPGDLSTRKLPRQFGRSFRH